jgi:FdhD protein
MTASDNNASTPFTCRVLKGDLSGSEPREVIEERPVRIVVNGSPLATLMRTPGNELELATGFLLTEGIVHSPSDIGAITFCRDGAMGEAGEILVRLSSTDPLALIPPKAGEGTDGKRRYRDVLSSCSLCGDEWLEAFADGIPPFKAAAHRLSADQVFRLRDAMSAQQPLFNRTGAAHAAAISGPSTTGGSTFTVVREDLGRHNALDKAVGAAIGAGIDLHRSLLFLSSRLSFEMVAKAARAGIADVAGVSAPSATAIRLAKRLNMFLAGFVRGKDMTVYAGEEALQ